MCRETRASIRRRGYSGAATHNIPIQLQRPMGGNKVTKITEPGQVQNRGKTGGMKFTVELKSIKDQYLRNHTSSGYLYVRCFRCVAKLRSFYVQNQPKSACNFTTILVEDFTPKFRCFTY